MKKASQIILLIAGIVAVIAAVGYLVASIVYFAAGGVVVMLDNGTINPADFPQWAQDIIDQVSANKDYGSYAALAAALFTFGAVLLILAILCIPAAVLSFVAKNKDNKVLYILCIIFGILSSTIVCAVGGIFGLIHQGVDKPEEEQAA